MLVIHRQSESTSTHPIAEGRGDSPEGAFYRYDRGGHELLRVVKRAGKDLVAGVAGEPVDLALVADGPLLVLCSKVGERLPWAGAAYHWHRVRGPERVLPPSGIDTVTGSRIDLVLMRSKGSRVRVVRPLTLPLQFSRVLHEAILEQARFTYNPGAEMRAMEGLLRRCPTPSLLVSYATIRATILP